MKPGRKKIEMKTKKLGNSDLSITPVGFGVWAIGGIEGKEIYEPELVTAV